MQRVELFPKVSGMAKTAIEVKPQQEIDTGRLETEYLLASAANVARLQQARKEFEGKQWREFDNVEELDKFIRSQY
jgi:hypothetical protein